MPRLHFLLSVLLATVILSAAATPPLNDHFTNAIEIEGLPAFGTGDNTGATREPGEPYSGTSNQSVWWRWTAPISGRVVMQSSGPWGYWLHVFTGTVVTNLSTVFLTPDGYRLFDVTEGTTYSVCVGSTAYSENGPTAFSFWPVAPNHRIEDALELAGLNPTAQITNGLSGQLWWKWTPPASCRVRLGISGDVTQYGIYLGRVTDGTNFQAVAQDYWRPFLTRVTSNETYYILVNPNRVTNALNAQLEITSFEQSDSFAGAVPLIGDDLSILADNSSATSEPEEPKHFFFSSGKTLWWRWQAPANGELNVTGLPDIGYAYPTLYRGSSLSSLQRVAPATNEVGPVVRTFVQSGEMLFIAVDGIWGGAGNFGLRLEFFEKPANDDFEDRAIVTDSGGIFIVAFGSATRQPGEPRIAQGAIARETDRTVWWTFKAARFGTLLVSAGDLEGHVPMDVGVFTGGSLRALRRQPIGRDVWGWDVKPNTEYQIVASPVRYARRGEVQIKFVAAPPNDDFDERLELVGEYVAMTNTILGATLQSGEPRLVSEANHRSVWYSWTAPDNGFVRIEAATTYSPLPISVFQGNQIKRLNNVASSLLSRWPNEGAFGARVSAGQTYVFVVNNRQQLMAGEFHLTLDFSRVELVTPANNSIFTQGTPVLFSISKLSSSPVLIGASYVIREPYAVREIAGGAPPYEVTVSNLTPGLHFVHCVTTHDDGTAHRSAPATFLVRPEGDDFGNPIHASGYVWSGDFWIEGAGVERREPRVKSATAGAGSIWVRWTAPANGTAILSPGVYEDMQISVYTGTRLGLLHPVRLKRQSDGWTYTFAARHGTTYHLRVARGVARGSFALGLTLPGTVMISPSSGTLYTQFVPIPLVASTTEPLDNIAEFSYVAGTNVIAFSNAPLTFLWKDAPPGRHAVFCRILTKAGLYIESPSVLIDVSPANDYFANRFQLSGLQARTRFSFHAVSTEAGEPLHGGVANGRTVWWTWTATATGRVRIRYTNWTVRPLIAVYTGDSISNLTSIAANGGWWRLWPAEQFEFDTAAGVSYQIAAAANEDGAGDIDVRMLLTPANDSFDHREHLVGTNILIAGTTLLTSREAGEPEPPSGCGYLSRSIWYSWIAPTNGSVMVDASGYGCVRIGTFTGTSLGSLAPVAFLGPYYGSDWALWEVVAGQAYEIVFDSGFGEIEDFSAHLVFTPSPSNDDFGGRVPLVGTTFEFAVDLVGSSFEPNEPQHSDIFGPRSVWFTWTPTMGGQFEVATDPVAILNVYTGDSLESLVPVPVTVNPQRLIVSAGATYQIAVGPFAPSANWFIYQGPITIRFAPR